MSDKPNITRLKASFRPMAIALATATICLVVTYQTTLHSNGDGARMQWAGTCLLVMLFFVVVLPAYILRTTGPRQREDATADDPWWQEVFAKFDAGARGPQTLSIIGLVLGPLYYFILRMWRKGLAITGIALCALVVLELLGLPSSIENVVGLVMAAFCMFMVKRDYYMFKRHDEIMWPQIKWLNSRIALTALIVVPLLVGVGWASHSIPKTRQPKPQ